MQLEASTPLPSPQELLGKIIIKNKKAKIPAEGKTKHNQGKNN